MPQNRCVAAQNGSWVFATIAMIRLAITVVVSSARRFPTRAMLAVVLSWMNVTVAAALSALTVLHDTVDCCIYH